MPLFTVSKSRLQPVAQSKFASEKILQQLVEGNLEVVFNCRLVASEFPTGAQHDRTHRYVGTLRGSQSGFTVCLVLAFACFAVIAAAVLLAWK